MTNKLTIDISHNRVAAGLMFAAAIGFSLTPLFIALGGSKSPFIFVTTFKISAAVGCLSILMTAYPRMFFSTDVWTIIWQHIGSLPMLFWVIASFDLAFYAWSTQFIDVSISAVLFEIRMILLIVLSGWLFRSEERQRKISSLTLVLFVFAFVGVASVIVSQGRAGGLDNLDEIASEPSLSVLAFGVGLVLAGAAISSMTTFGFRWAANLVADLSEGLKWGNDSLALFSAAVGIVITCLPTAFVAGSIGFTRNEPVSSEPIAFGILGGILVGALSAIAWRKADLINNDLSINSMVYLTPALSLGLLFAFGLVGEVAIGYLIIGAAAIIIANLGIYFERGAPHERPSEIRVEIDPKELIAAGESDSVEFKSSLRTNLYKNERDKRTELAALRTLAAFLNTDGGTLIVGVADDGSAVGIEVDRFESEDRMSLHIRNIVVRDMGPLAMTYIHPTFADYDGRRVLMVRCDRSEQPIYLKDGNTERFYVRTGPSTTDLPTSDIFNYISDRF